MGEKTFKIKSVVKLLEVSSKFDIKIILKIDLDS